MQDARGLEALTTRLSQLSDATPGMVVGLTGSVAVGKTTLATKISDTLSERHRVEMVSTDGFLFPNKVLDELGLTLRKGFPETYDHVTIAQALTQLRAGEADFPAYSHVTYDVDPSLTRTIEQPDILILEGLGFQPLSEPPRRQSEPNLLIYLDADLELIVTWFLERFLRFWHAAKDDPSSFYAQFLHMSEPELIEFARSVWQGINLPNLEDHILPLRDAADFVVCKDSDHNIQLVTDRT